MGQVFQKAVPRGTWPTVMEAIAEQTRWVSASPVYVYAESVGECLLVSNTFGNVAPPDLAFEGRIFDADKDVRWISHETGEYEAWMVREAQDADPPDAVEAYGRCESRPYYLLGIAGEIRGVFQESKFPDKKFMYDVDARPHDRAFIQVTEYYAAAADWDQLRATGQDALVEALNRPMLIAHRFVKLDAGRTSD